MAGEALGSQDRSNCFSLDWASYLTDGTILDRRRQRREQAAAMQAPLLEAQEEGADCCASPAPQLVQAGRKGDSSSCKGKLTQKQSTSLRSGLLAGPVLRTSVCVMLLALSALAIGRVGYMMGESRPEAMAEQEIQTTLARLAAAEHELEALGRRGHTLAPGVAPPSDEQHRDLWYTGGRPYAPGPAPHRQAGGLSGINLDVYELEEGSNASSRSMHRPFFDGPASWLVGESEDLDRPREPIRDEAGTLLPLKNPLRVCLLTADFWGRKGAGGTATAYSLLAAALDEDPDLEVLMLAVTEDWAECKRSRGQQSPRHLLVDYVCLEERHFQPPIIKTHPYELVSHAVLKWAIEHQYECDVFQVHEWGGVFQDLVAYSHLRQFRPGVRVAINTHGGHYWSSEGQLPRPTDIMSLRIDHGERATLELSDIVLSPTRYIMSWLRQRGWHMPSNRLPLPNLITDIDAAPTLRVEKPVWRLAFFSRLEERKGIKLFVDAVNRLPASITGRPGFEVVFMGSEAKIDQLRSGLWLERKTARWDFNVSIYMNLPREAALEKLSEEGFLLVQASLIDNMPYVLAEASVHSIPLIIYDVGGVTEMIDPKVHADVLVGTPKSDGLAVRMREVLEAGVVNTTVLSPRVTNGKALWQAWHHDFSINQLHQCIEDDKVVREEAPLMETDYEVLTVQRNTSALELYEEVCDNTGCSDIGCSQNSSDYAGTVLLLPEEFELLDAGRMGEYVELINIARLRADDNIGGLAFGAEVPEYNDTGLRLAYPTAPTWQLYEGEVEPWVMSDKCTENVPVLIRRATFCGAFNADARNFPQYSSFTMSLMLAQSGLRLITYPEAAFRLNRWTANGYQCIMDKTPDRRLDLQVAANLMSDDELMLSQQLTPKVRPFVDFVADFSGEQGHRGWQYGYIDLSGQDSKHQVADLEAMQQLQFVGDASGQTPDGEWRTPQSKYPNMHRYILHPCAGWSRGQCAGVDKTAAVLRFQSYIAVKQTVFVLVYEVFPRCGDGVHFEVVFTPVDALGEAMVMHREDHGRMTKPLRQRLHFYIDQLEAGDMIDLVTLPKENHDCDGVLLLEAQLWDAREYSG